MRKVPLKEGLAAEKARAKTKAWRLANPEREAENKRRYAQENAEKLRAYKAQWHAENRERITAKRQETRKDPVKAAALKAQNAAHYRRHREKIAEANKRRYLANREENIRKRLAYAKAHPEEERARKQNWAKKNAPRLQAKRKEYYVATKEIRAPKEARRRAENARQNTERTSRWRRKNPERYAAHAHTRRVKAGPAIQAETAVALLRVRVCHYCGVGLVHDKTGAKGPRHPCKVTIDHLLPISRDGTNADENLVAACLACNTRKNKKTAEEYFAVLAKRL